MNRITRYTAIAAVFALSSAPRLVAADTEVLFDVDDPSSTLFPSDLFTVLDLQQNTFRRVNLPKPDCATQPIACEDIDVLNTFDGFNLQPRLSIPFSGPIDVSTVNSDTVFLLSLGSTQGFGSLLDKIGINQVVWDVATNTLHATADETLAPHTRYALIVTRGVRDAAGQPIASGIFDWFRNDHDFSAQIGERVQTARQDINDVVSRARKRSSVGIAAATVFTTSSTTSTLEKIRRQLDAAQPAAADFNIGSNGERTVFPLSSISRIVFNRQVTTTTVSPLVIPHQLLSVVPGVIGSVAFGKFSSPNYLVAGDVFPVWPSRTGTPVAQGAKDIYFDLFLPAGPRPAAGWPVAIFGHGFGADKDGAPYAIAAKLAEQGIALISINAHGHGFGAGGTQQVTTAAGVVTFPAGGRGIDQNGDTRIEATEGVFAARPFTLMGLTDAVRQTVVDLMQLTRTLKAGVDSDGDSLSDVDPSRIYYFGQSFGGIYGTMFLAIEPSVLVGAPNVAGGPTIQIIRLAPNFRLGIFVPNAAARGLSNAPPVNGVPQFIENLPLRNQPAVTNTVPGAMALQQWIDRVAWTANFGDPTSYARHLRKAPLRGVPAKRLLFTFAKGDFTVPNPTSTAIIRAGELLDTTSYYRTDLAVAANPATLRNPHTFLTTINGAGLSAQVAFATQTQIATFFASDGRTIVDPDGAGPLFEVPAAVLPEELNFLQ